MKPIVIYGAGGVGRGAQQFVADINCRQPTWDLIGFVDDRKEIHGNTIREAAVLGGFEWLAERKKQTHVVVAIGDPKVRRQIVADLSDISTISLASLIHPDAWVAEAVAVRLGSIIYPGCIIDVGAEIGRSVILNMNAVVGHDAKIKDFATVAPGANIGGNVQLGTGCDIGMGAAIIQETVVGDSAVIGAGAAVIEDIPEGVTAVGVPTRIVGAHS